MSESALQRTQPTGMEPMEMIQVAFNKAIEQGSAMDVVNTILEQQRWIIQHNEEEKFNAALKRIQKQLKRIPKRGWNDQTKSHFALSQDIDDVIQSLLDEESMTLSYKPSPSPNQCEVIIIATLSLGAYSKEYPLPMPADGMGPKGTGVMSRTHATGSAITYAKRYLKDLIFDLRYEDPKYKSLDDDGNSAGTLGVMDENAVREFLDNIGAASDHDELKKFYFEAYRAAKSANDKTAEDAFVKAKEIRKAYLDREGK